MLTFLLTLSVANKARACANIWLHCCWLRTYISATFEQHTPNIGMTTTSEYMEGYIEQKILPQALILKSITQMAKIMMTINGTDVAEYARIGILSLMFWVFENK